MRGSSDDLDAVGMLLIGLALLIIAGAVAALVWYAVTGIVIVVRYYLYSKKAEERYQQLEADVGIGYDTDDVFRSVFGESADFSEGDIDNPVDWFSETVIGRKFDETV
jgi:hypothetical protein